MSYTGGCVLINSVLLGVYRFCITNFVLSSDVIK